MKNSNLNTSFATKITSVFLLPIGIIFLLTNSALIAQADDTVSNEQCNGGSCSPDFSGDTGAASCACGSSSGGCSSNHSG